MHASYLLALGVAGALLAACRPAAPPAVAEAPAPVAVSTPATAAPVTPTVSSEPGASTMERTCGAAHIRLATGAVPEQVTLLFVQPDGTAKAAPAPAGLSDYVPVGLACARGRDGADYVVVQYGEAEEGCSVCEWFALFDATGAALTRHEPAFVEIPDLPPAQRQAPNNAEYDAAIVRLGIAHPEIDYFR